MSIVHALGLYSKLAFELVDQSPGANRIQFCGAINVETSDMGVHIVTVNEASDLRVMCPDTRRWAIFRASADGVDCVTSDGTLHETGDQDFILGLGLEAHDHIAFRVNNESTNQSGRRAILGGTDITKTI